VGAFLLIENWIEPEFWLLPETGILYDVVLYPFDSIKIIPEKKGTIILLHITHRQLTLATIALSVFGVLPAAGQVINEDLKLTASDGAGNQFFGFSIAIDNDLVAVGASQDDDNGTRSGSAYVFDASTGVQIAKLVPDDGEGFDFFGWSIGISNGIVAVGAHQDGDNGTASGSAYVFDASTGAQLFKLLPDDGAEFDWFGTSIAIDNGIVVVGANEDDNENGNFAGAAYLFDASTGAQLFKLLPNDGSAGDGFGYSVAIDNGVVAVGAWFDTDNGGASGSAYLFNASTGAQITKLLANDGAQGDHFGTSIAIDNGVVAVGASDKGNFAGAAYLFNASGGFQIAKLLPNDGASADFFGLSVGIDNGVVAVASPGDDDNASGSGSAYLFDASTGGQITKLLPSDGGFSDNFGSAIAIANGVIAVGAFKDNDNGGDSGSAYLFDTGASCAADLNGDGVLDFFDVSAFLNAFSAQDPVADFNGDGLFDFFDVQAFLNAYAVGCP
jgi:FG-GAP repeat